MSSLETKDTEVHTPQLTDTLVGKTPGKEELKNDFVIQMTLEFFEDDSDGTIDNTV